MSIPIVTDPPVDPAVDPDADPIEDPQDPTDPHADPDAPIDGEDALGDPGKRAIEAIKAKYKSERTKRLAAEKVARDATASKDGEPDADQIRADITREVTEKANQKIVRAEVKTAAASMFEDPADALAFLDLTTFDVDDDGEVDADEIKSALEDLIAKKPHLAKQNLDPQRVTKRRIPEVPADPANKQSTPVSIADRIKAAQTAGDYKTVMSLQNSLLDQQK